MCTDPGHSTPPTPTHTHTHTHTAHTGENHTRGRNPTKTVPSTYFRRMSGRMLIPSHCIHLMDCIGQGQVYVCVCLCVCVYGVLIWGRESGQKLKSAHQRNEPFLYSAHVILLGFVSPGLHGDTRLFTWYMSEALVLLRGEVLLLSAISEQMLYSQLQGSLV